MGHSLSKLRRPHPQTQLPSQNNSISSSSSTFNSSFNGGSTENISIPSSPSSSNAVNGNTYAFAANAPRPSASPNYYHHPPPPYSSSSLSMMASPPFCSLTPPAYVDHKTAKKIKSDVNIHKDTISLFLDHNHLDSLLLSFTFDALVDGSITIFYFAKEGLNCNFMPMYPEIYMPKTIPFQKGLAQKFYQPSGTGISLGFFEFNLLSRLSKEEDDICPLVISAETSFPSFMSTADFEQPPHAQITQAVLKLNDEGHFEVKVIKQILWIEGIRYELREIYGIENCNEQGVEDDSESFGTRVICMTEPKDTAVLPCRHMCLCSECAKQLRLKSKRCPVCRHSIQELIEIKIENQLSKAFLEAHKTHLLDSVYKQL